GRSRKSPGLDQPGAAYLAYRPSHAARPSRPLQVPRNAAGRIPGCDRAGKRSATWLLLSRRNSDVRATTTSFIGVAGGAERVTAGLRGGVGSAAGAANGVAGAGAVCVRRVT